MVDDYRATPEERRLAETLGQRSAETSSPAGIAGAIQQLEQVLQAIEQRGHRRPEPTTGPPSQALIQLQQVLIEAEEKWRRSADKQLRLGLVSLPAALVLVILLALSPLWTETMIGLLLVSVLVAGAASYTFLLLRIHQQARQAEERMVEKRVGLAFLRIAIEDHTGRPELNTLVKAGTQMFLGHHAAPTVPLGPEDLRLALFGTPRSGEK
ncbi:MAG TPA: hypothetical protein VHQ65_12890 [Thermoanaerobaculia bacterium]|nr:hypothetical protein [Thermoanaerobaculia bacterium]